MLKSQVAIRPTVMRERVRSGMPAQEADRRSETMPMVVLPFRDDSSVYEQNAGGGCAVEAWRLELMDRGEGGVAGSAGAEGVAGSAEGHGVDERREGTALVVTSRLRVAGVRNGRAEHRELGLAQAWCCD